MAERWICRRHEGTGPFTRLRATNQIDQQDGANRDERPARRVGPVPDDVAVRGRTGPDRRAARTIPRASPIRRHAEQSTTAIPACRSRSPARAAMAGASSAPTTSPRAARRSEQLEERPPPVTHECREGQQSDQDHEVEERHVRGIVPQPAARSHTATPRRLARPAPGPPARSYTWESWSRSPTSPIHTSARPTSCRT